MNVMNNVFELAKDLNLRLNREQIGLVVGLCEKGVNPEVIVTIIKELESSSESALQR